MGLVAIGFESGHANANVLILRALGPSGYLLEPHGFIELFYFRWVLPACIPPVIKMSSPVV